jgi:TonB-dependent SusC/RagA subfamily outer membrane receptor
MSPSIAYLLKMVLVSGILYTYYHLVLRDKRFHEWNRFYLLAAVLLSITLPLFHIPVQSAEDTDNRLLFQVWQLLGKDNSHATVVRATEAARLNWITLIGYVYAAAVLLQLGVLGTRLLRLRRLRDRSPLAHVEGITLVTTEDEGTPFSFFRWIFWNRALELDSTEGRRVFAHEMTHVRQGHSADKVFLQIVCILFFPIVFFYLIRKELQLIHEYLADKQATRDEDTEAYARLLLSQAFQASPYVFANSFFQHPLKRRLIMMTRFSNPRYTYLRKIMFLPLALILFGLLAFRVEKTHPTEMGRVIRVAEKIQKVFLTPVITVADAPAKTAQTAKIVSPVIIKATAVPAIAFEAPKVTEVRIADVKHDTVRPEVTVIGRASDSSRQFHLIASNLSYRVAGVDSVLYVIDGSPVNDNFILASLNPEKIESITVLKDAAATAIYGPRGSHGVILITLKDPNAGAAEPDGDNKVFTKVEVEAQFPGGDAAWNEYIRKTITAHMDNLQDEGKSGTCELLFIVNKDGTVTGVQPLTMQGTVLAAIAVNAISNGPHWIPAQQNGRTVKAFRKEKITFQMPSE